MPYNQEREGRGVGAEDRTEGYLEIDKKDIKKEVDWKKETRGGEDVEDQNRRDWFLPTMSLR